MSYKNRLSHLKNVSVSENSPRWHGETEAWGGWMEWKSIPATQSERIALVELLASIYTRVHLKTASGGGKARLFVNDRFDPRDMTMNWLSRHTEYIEKFTVDGTRGKVRWGRKPVGYPENATKWSTIKGRYINIEVPENFLHFRGDFQELEVNAWRLSRVRETDQHEGNTRIVETGLVL